MILTINTSTSQLGEFAKLSRSFNCNGDKQILKLRRQPVTVLKETGTLFNGKWSCAVDVEWINQASTMSHELVRVRYTGSNGSEMIRTKIITNNGPYSFDVRLSCGQSGGQVSVTVNRFNDLPFGDTYDNIINDTYKFGTEDLHLIGSQSLSSKFFCDNPTDEEQLLHALSSDVIIDNIEKIFSYMELITFRWYTVISDSRNLFCRVA